MPLIACLLYAVARGVLTQLAEPLHSGNARYFISDKEMSDSWDDSGWHVVMPGRRVTLTTPVMYTLMNIQIRQGFFIIIILGCHKCWEEIRLAGTTPPEGNDDDVKKLDHYFVLRITSWNSWCGGGR